MKIGDKKRLNKLDTFEIIDYNDKRVWLAVRNPQGEYIANHHMTIKQWEKAKGEIK